MSEQGVGASRPRTGGPPGSARITFVGHSEVMIELAGTRLLTDPVHRDRILGLIRRMSGPPAPEAREGIDAILISHTHADHLDFPTLRSIPGDWRLIVPAGTGALFRRHGFERAEEVLPGDAVTVGEARITATPAEHDGRRWKVGRRLPALGYALAGAGKRLYFAGDTDLFPEMEEIGGDDLDVALLPIGGWGMKVEGGHLDPRRAAEAAARLRPNAVVPIHWGTLLRSDLARRRPDHLRVHPPEFIAQLAALAPAVAARVLDPGGSLEL